MCFFKTFIFTACGHVQLCPLPTKAPQPPCPIYTTSLFSTPVMCTDIQLLMSSTSYACRYSRPRHRDKERSNDRDDDHGHEYDLDSFVRETRSSNQDTHIPWPRNPEVSQSTSYSSPQLADRKPSSIGLCTHVLSHPLHTYRIHGLCRECFAARACRLALFDTKANKPQIRVHLDKSHSSESVPPADGTAASGQPRNPLSNRTRKIDTGAKLQGFRRSQETRYVDAVECGHGIEIVSRHAPEIVTSGWQRHSHKATPVSGLSSRSLNPSTKFDLAKIRANMAGWMATPTSPSANSIVETPDGYEAEARASEVIWGEDSRDIHG